MLNSTRVNYISPSLSPASLVVLASALQPNNGRVREWLEQTQAALAGGPQPLLADFRGFGTDAPAQSPSEDSSEKKAAADPASAEPVKTEGSAAPGEMVASAAPDEAAVGSAAPAQSPEAADSAQQAPAIVESTRTVPV